MCGLWAELVGLWATTAPAIYRPGRKRVVGSSTYPLPGFPLLAACRTPAPDFLRILRLIKEPVNGTEWRPYVALALICGICIHQSKVQAEIWYYVLKFFSSKIHTLWDKACPSSVKVQAGSDVVAKPGNNLCPAVTPGK